VLLLPGCGDLGYTACLLIWEPGKGRRPTWRSQRARNGSGHAHVTQAPRNTGHLRACLAWTRSSGAPWTGRRGRGHRPPRMPAATARRRGARAGAVRTRSSTILRPAQPVLSPSAGRACRPGGQARSSGSLLRTEQGLRSHGRRQVAGGG
jgi:hypothetical protein